MNLISGALVFVFGAFLVGLAATTVVKAARAVRFLESFASSARAHYTEHSLRLLAGAAMALFSSSMWFPELFRLFGWVLVVTSFLLLLTPWQWHHRYGEWTIPIATRHLKLFGLGSLALGSFVLYGWSRVLIS